MKPKILTTLADYSTRQFVSDVLAGLTVALVALPLSIAIAIASGAQPAVGLITAIVAGFFISALGGSRVQIGGPTGAFIVVVYGVIQAHGYAGLIVATLMAGVILLVAGLLRTGQLIRHISEPVIEGFTVGIAIIIAVSQIKDLAGMTGPALPADFLPKLAGLWGMRGTINMAALLMGIACIAAILILRRAAPRIPWLVIVVALASLAAATALPSVETVAERYGALPRGLPMPQIPTIRACPVARSVAIGPDDRVSGGRRIAPFSRCRRSHDRSRASFQCRVDCTGCGQHSVVPVRRPSRNGRHRAHGNQCERRRQDARRGDSPCPVHPRSPCFSPLRLPVRLRSRRSRHCWS